MFGGVGIKANRKGAVDFLVITSGHRLGRRLLVFPKTSLCGGDDGLLTRYASLIDDE